MDFEQGKTYEFVGSDGTIFRARFDGLGQWMRPVWKDPETGAEFDPFPPIQSYRQID